MRIHVLVAALTLACAILFGTAVASAGLGVGVNIGQISVDEALEPGSIYELPVVTVSNTGTEAADYELAVTYYAQQAESKPPQAWFRFDPASFALKPGESREVKARLVLPVGADPGKYFAFLEAHPVPGDEAVSIGVAAATKLQFDVRSASFWGALLNRLQGWLLASAPASYILLGAVVATGAVVVLRRYFSIELGIRRKRRY